MTLPRRVQTVQDIGLANVGSRDRHAGLAEGRQHSATVGSSIRPEPMTTQAGTVNDAGPPPGEEPSGSRVPTGSAMWSRMPHRHFLELREAIHDRLRTLRPPCWEEQIEQYPWLYGALGDPNADVMFICENPSLSALRAVRKALGRPARL